MDEKIEKIIAIFWNRSGFDHWWDNIDVEFQEEIKDEIAEVLTKE